MPIIEICVDSLESALAAAAGGADRLELCSGLAEGGLTPSLGLLRRVRAQVSCAVHVLVRPRPGDFLYSAGELAVLRDDIALARDEGAQGIALGLLTPEGNVAVEQVQALVQAAGPMEVTFHRAFDLVNDPQKALQEVLECGAHRILTSGGARTALEGQQQLAELISTAGDRIGIMVGGGVRPRNVQAIARTTGARQFHAALRRTLPSPMRHHVPAVRLGDVCLDDYVRRVTCADDVRSLRQAAEVE